jgi:hypothetical protein
MTGPSKFDRCVTVAAVVLALALLAIVLGGCAKRGDAPDVGIVHYYDFSAMVPAILFWSVIGCAACIAALIWVPIQKWIPLAGLTFFGSCGVLAVTVSELLPWMPWIIGGGVILGLLWLFPYLRRIVIDVRRSWNEPAEAPNPPLITAILKDTPHA